MIQLDKTSNKSETYYKVNSVLFVGTSKRESEHIRVVNSRTTRAHGDAPWIIRNELKRIIIDKIKRIIKPCIMNYTVLKRKTAYTISACTIGTKNEIEIVLH